MGETEETTVAEVWGDRFYAQRESGRVAYSIAASEASAWHFLRVKTLPLLKLCDLTDPATLLATGLDAATLYHTDITIPQAWAEVIARHRARFDGILYRSRHTAELCIVAWVRPDRALDREFVFEPTAPFLNSLSAHAVAAKMKLGLSFVS